MDAVIWLEDYLADWNKILFFVSHSQDFMNNVCTHIVRLDQKYKKLRYYSGNYDTYVASRREADIVQKKAYDAEQRDIAEIKDFIAKYGHGTAKLVRQAQSREKLLEKKLEAGLTDMPEEDAILDFNFPDPGELPTPVLMCQELSFGYPGCAELYSDVEFGIDLGSRVALVGPNGAGKTTLVKLLAGELFPTKGAVRPHSHLRMSRFTQHFEDVLDLTKTPIQFFKDVVMPKKEYDYIRSWLGRYGCAGAVQSQVMEQLSAGQKARIVFAKMASESPHLILLDEPTNALDMNAIDSLARAINNFKGGVILVSHDMRLISQVAKELWICDHKQVKEYRGDIMKFKLAMRKQIKTAAGKAVMAQHING
jgi:ATP-binding cassette, subfamily F, member 2